MQITKIKFKITHSDLLIVNMALSFIHEPSMQNRQSKAIKSILQEIYTKLLKKAIDKSGTTIKFSISLKYHEAHFLEGCLIEANKEQYTHALQKVINELNQKLA